MPDLYIWILFHVVVGALILLDLGFFHRRQHVVHYKEALLWSGFWIAFSLLFNLFIYFVRGEDSALQFLTGYLIEKSLSVDNIFVFVLIFSFFNIAPRHQHKVLYWGIIGALVMRIAFILAGIALIDHFHFFFYVFGAVILFTGVKMIITKERKIHPERNWALKFCKSLFSVETDYQGKFFIREKKALKMTTLFLALIMIESSDVIFALDSIMAIFAVSRDPLIIYTSNICAILGLRSLYFVLADAAERFRYLKAGISCILVFIGLKMVLTPVYQISSGLSLSVIALILAGAIFCSINRRR